MFLRLHPNTAFWPFFFDYEGYSFSSKGFLPTVVDIMVIGIEFAHSGPYLDSILKSRDITLPIKVHLVKAVVFPVVVYGCESCTIKKAERQRVDAFELMLEKTLESPLDSKEIQPVHPKGDQS